MIETLARMPKAARVASMAWMESTSLGARVLKPANERKIEAYLASHAVRKLHLGCGPRVLDGWLNSDFHVSLKKLVDDTIPLIQLDCTRGLPMPDGSFDCVYSEHMHEHLGYDAGIALLAEIRRILKPGGKVRIAIPDLDFLARMIDSERSFAEYADAFKDQIWQIDGLEGAPLDKTTFLNFVFKGAGHKYIYSREALNHQVAAAGFEDVRTLEPGESDSPELKGLETDLTGRDAASLQMHLSYTIAVEGTKLS